MMRRLKGLERFDGNVSLAVILLGKKVFLNEKVSLDEKVRLDKKLFHDKNARFDSAREESMRSEASP